MAEEARERAILLGIDLKGRAGGRAAGEGPRVSAEESLDELVVLAESAGAQVVDRILQSRDAAEAATLVGSGKVDEIAAATRADAADVVIVDRELSPTQLRNLEDRLDCKVVDRTQLILDIFARRARTREGQLQVELAQLNYLLPRLTGQGRSMSRLGGGIGTRGPGETQLETDRRRIFRRIRKIEEDLEAVRAGRGVQRRQRQEVPLATVSLVGYTNAGKSTLFNRFTGAAVLADAKMFATLDPTVRHVILPSNRRVLFSDTVGFIRQLPTTLVKAFRATLEEVVEASLLLHVVDASSPQAPEHVGHVMRVLAEIGAAETQQLLVLNKTDLLPGGEADPDTLASRLLAESDTHVEAPRAVAVSGLTGAGFDELLRAVDTLLPIDPVSRVRLRIPHSDGAALHFAHEYARVLEKSYDGEYAELTADTPESVKRRLARYIVEG